MAQNPTQVSTTPPLPGLTLVQTVNGAIETIASDFAGSIDPAATAFAYATWADTGTGDLKRRNAANNDWDVIGRIFPQTTEDASGNVSIAGSLTVAGSALASPAGLFAKANPSAVAWERPTGSTVRTSQDLVVEVDGSIYEIAALTTVAMPTLVTGTDYAIWIQPDGSLIATSAFFSTGGVGEAANGSRRVGGFHYAPGGNATGTSGGDTTAQINEYSFWDLKFRPACPDPRGMTLVAGGFWTDIYTCGVDHYTNGTSKFNVPYARGTTPPKVPAQFGGNGTATYSNGNWWNFAEVMRSHGKRLPTYSEVAAYAYGTTEASSVGSDQVNTVLNAAFTSKWGVIQSTGVLWTWGDEFGGGAAGASWTANTDGRGSTFQMENAARFGGTWSLGSFSGSRCSHWGDSPSFSTNIIGGRGVCDHLQLD